MTALSVLFVLCLLTSASAARAGVQILHSQAACVAAAGLPALSACSEKATGAARARVRFRAAAGTDGYWVDMRAEGSCFSADLPKPSPDAHTVHYVEVQDTTPDAVVFRLEGRTEEPFVLAFRAPRPETPWPLLPRNSQR